MGAQSAPAGGRRPEASLPGTSDLWIAVDGGWLVRDRFSSTYLESATDIRPLEEDEVEIERPVR